MSTPDWVNIHLNPNSKFIVVKAADTANLPTYAAGDPAPILVDKDTGKLLTNATSGGGGGGGTQYTEGDTAAAPTVTAAGFQRSDNTIQVPLVDSSNRITITPLDIASDDVAIGGELDDIATVAATEGQVALARITAQRALHVNLRNNAGAEITTLPVSLASVPSHAVTNAGTFAVQASEADGTNVTLGAKADAKSAATDTTPVSAMSVLKQISASVQAPPSQAVTQATGTNLHTVVDSGTISTITNVVHVDDNAGSLTVDNAGTFAVQATIAAGATSIAKAEDVASADADVGVPAMAIRKATPANTSGTDGDYEMLQMSAGRLWASATIDAALPAGANAIGKLAANSGVTIGAVEIAAAQTLSTVTNLAQLGGAAIAMGTGVRSAGTPRVTISTDDVVPASQSGTWTVQPGNTANTTPWLVQQAAGTTNGWTTHTKVSAASTNATSVKGSAGTLHSFQIYNQNASVRYVKFADKATATTPGSDASVIIVAVPPGSGVSSGPIDALFALGITYCTVTGATEADTTGVAINEVHINLQYK